MPRAKPLTIVTPRAASSAATRSAVARPYGVARRAPTIATASASSAASAPRTHSAGGDGTARSRAGYPGASGWSGVTGSTGREAGVRRGRSESGARRIARRGGPRHGPPDPPTLGAPREARGAPRPPARRSICYAGREAGVPRGWPESGARRSLAARVHCAGAARKRVWRDTPSARPRLALGGRVLAEEGAGEPRRLSAGVLAHDPLPRRARAARVAEGPVAEPDLQERVRDLARAHLEHFLKLDERLPVVALDVVRLADPVLRVGREGVLRIRADEVDELEHGLAVLARAERRERRPIGLLRRARRGMRHHARRGPRLGARLGGCRRRRHGSGRGARLDERARLPVLLLGGVQAGRELRELLARRPHALSELPRVRGERLKLGAGQGDVAGGKLLGGVAGGDLSAEGGDIALEAIH